MLNLYSGAMSFLSMGVRIPARWRRAIVAVGFGVIGFVVGTTGQAGPGGKYEDFLSFNTYWIVPFLRRGADRLGDAALPAQHPPPL